MHPIRRVINDLGGERGANHDEAGDEHDEHRRAVARIGKAIIKPARLAARRQSQKAAEQLALAAARARATQSGRDGACKRTGRQFGHGPNIVRYAAARKRMAEQPMVHRSVLLLGSKLINFPGSLSLLPRSFVKCRKPMRQMVRARFIASQVSLYH